MTFNETAEIFRKDFGKVYTQCVEEVKKTDTTYTYFKTDYMIWETTEKIIGIMEKLTLSFQRQQKRLDNEVTIFNDINLALTIEEFLRKYGFKLELTEIVEDDCLVRFQIRRI